MVLARTASRPAKAPVSGRVDLRAPKKGELVTEPPVAPSLTRSVTT